MLIDGIERRKHQRAACVDCVDIYVEKAGNREPIHGVCMNISDEGICVFTTTSLKEGEVVEIKENSSSRPRKAVVKWDRLYFSKYYRSGLKLAA